MIFLLIFFFTNTERPDPPVDVETHNPTAESVTLTWKPPMYDGGSKIMGYILEKMMKGEDQFKRCNDFLVPVLSYTVKGLTEGKQYQFRVSAENAAGVSDPSRSSPFVKASDAIGMNLIFCYLSNHKVFFFKCEVPLMQAIGTVYVSIFCYSASRSSKSIP